jgi:hypothetical protein
MQPAPSTMKKTLQIIFAFTGLITLIIAVVLFFTREGVFDLKLFLLLYLPAPLLTIVAMRAHFLCINLRKLNGLVKAVLIGSSAVLFLAQLFFSMFFFVPLLGGSSITLELRLLGYFFFVGAILNFSVLYRLTDPIKASASLEGCA